MKTKIFYDDGTEIITMGLGTYEPEAEGGFMPITRLPKRGVIAMVTVDPEVGWISISGADYYIFKKNHWVGSDFFGLLDFLKTEGLLDYGIGWKKIRVGETWLDADMVDLFAFVEAHCPVLFGRWTTHEEYLRILQRVEDAREFGAKHGWLQAERQPERRIY